MNREIKFRAWDKGQKCMIGKWFTILPNNEPLILMQYTGLKDKNGVEIYEGDIIKYSRGEQEQPDSFYECIDTTRSSYGGFIICGRNGQDFSVQDDMVTIKNCMWRSSSCMNGSYIYHEIDSIEVIGNIYENPELLEAK